MSTGGTASGFAMKVANLWAVMERHPGVRTISTWNAAENAPMIAVNEEIGFAVEALSDVLVARLPLSPGPSSRPPVA